MLDVTFLLSAFVTLLVTIAPFETAPVFVGLARHLAPDDRRRTVRRAVMISGLVLVAFALIGKGLLGPLHVSLPALRIAGVLVMLAICLGLTWASVASAETLTRLLGVTGSDVIGRISGLLLGALAMQYVFDGLNEGLLKRLG